MKTIAHFPFLLIAVLLFSQNTFGCSCIEYYTPDCVKIARSDAVFYGKIEKLFWVTEEEDKTKVLTETEEVKHSVGGNFLVRFSVIEIYKGEIENKIDVYSNIGSSCTGEHNDMKIGDKWTIYADQGTKSKQWYTQIGTCAYSRQGAGNRFLEYFKAGKSKENVQGRILNETPHGPGLNNIQVRIEGQGFSATTKTKDYDDLYPGGGLFNIEVPVPGEYKISFFLPSASMVYNFFEGIEIKTFPSTKETRVEHLVDVPKGLCDFTQFQTFPIEQENP